MVDWNKRSVYTVKQKYSLGRSFLIFELWNCEIVAAEHVAY